MNSSEIRRRFLEFFKKRGHAVIPSASLVTSDEKGITNPTLFNTAGMLLIPYLLGQPYLINGKPVDKLVDVQKCLRTVDIDDIGDKTHATFFEMLGNWSLGDYFKKQAIEWSYELLTSKEEGFGYDEKTGFGIKPERLYVTVFEGDANAPRDDEAAKIWHDIFKKNKIDVGGDASKGEAGRIFYLPADKNWWEAGDNGPCGPDSEMFYDVSDTFKGRTLTHDEYLKADQASQVVEVWNDVFMQYVKKDGKIVSNLPKPSVDTGAGLERLAMVLQGKDNIFDTDLLKPVMERMISEAHGGNTLKERRIIADHIRASSFLIVDGVEASNTGRGYILRRLLRKAVRKAQIIELDIHLFELVDYIADAYRSTYQIIETKKQFIRDQIYRETERFNLTIGTALNEFKRISVGNISGTDAFKLFSSYGLPIDLTIELAKEKGVTVDVKAFEAEFKKHQELSRSGAEQKFKGGLADANDPMVVRYHTATHLLHQALHDVLGEGVAQKGSNITAERLRFDFSYGAKMTDEQKKKVEDIVNEKIQAKLPMNNVVMTRAEAEKTGARHFFGEKYGDQISIYFIGQALNPPTADDLKNAYSKEFCGGPHVKNTFELAGPEGKWKFKIQKEEAISQGVRRIKAVLA